MVNNAQKTDLELVLHDNELILIPSKIAGIGPIPIKMPGIGAALNRLSPYPCRFGKEYVEP